MSNLARLRAFVSSCSRTDVEWDDQDPSCRHCGGGFSPDEEWEAETGERESANLCPPCADMIAGNAMVLAPLLSEALDELERLRVIVREGPGIYVPAVATRAADEIDRLRSENVSLGHALEAARSTLGANGLQLEREIDRLRGEVAMHKENTHQVGLAHTFQREQNEGLRARITKLEVNPTDAEVEAVAKAMANILDDGNDYWADASRSQKSASILHARAAIGAFLSIRRTAGTE